jgi:hypothetical protein
MSMLTPRGMGGKYRIKGNKYPRMRRRGRRRSKIVITVIASAAAVGLIGWGSLQLLDVFTGGDRASAAGARDCATPSPSHATRSAAHAGATASPAAPRSGEKLPEPGKITVNVFNATTRTGLAKDTADELKKRGFKIGKVGNATPQYDKKVKGIGVLLGPRSALHSALPVLGTQLTGAQQLTDTRKGTEVDLIIGTGFKTLATPSVASKALTALTHPAPPPPAKKEC